MRKERSPGVSHVFASMRWAALANGARGGRCRFSGAMSWCSLARISAISGVVAYWSPSSERACQNVIDVPVGDDRLIHVDDADGGIVDRFQPSGDRYRTAGVINVGAGAGDPGDDGSLQAVDGVGPQAQQAGSRRRLVPAIAHACLSASWEPFIRSRTAWRLPACSNGNRADYAVEFRLVPLSAVPVVRAVMTMLWTCGMRMPCGPQWCSKEAITQRWGLTGENRVRPASCRSLSAS